jgi:hypothetical protein
LQIPIAVRSQDEYDKSDNPEIREFQDIWIWRKTKFSRPAEDSSLFLEGRISPATQPIWLIRENKKVYDYRNPERTSNGDCYMKNKVSSILDFVQ